MGSLASVIAVITAPYASGVLQLEGNMACVLTDDPQSIVWMDTHPLLTSIHLLREKPSHIQRALCHSRLISSNHFKRSRFDCCGFRNSPALTNSTTHTCDLFTFTLIRWGSKVKATSENASMLLFFYLKNSSPRNENVLRMYLLSGHPSCSWVCFFMETDLENCIITSLAHQWILCSQWVPSEWESKQLIKRKSQ